MKQQNCALLINSLASGGAEKVITTLISEFYNQGIRVRLICIENNVFYKLPPDIHIDFLTKLSGNEPGFLKFLYLPFLAWKLKSFVTRNNISIVQSHVYRANYVNVLSKLFGSRHIVQVVNHGLMSRYLLKGTLGKINLLLIRCLYSKADLIIFISKAMGLDIDKLFNFSNQKKLINNPHDIRGIRSKSIEETYNFKFDSNKIYIVSVGRLIALKRNKDLIDAVRLCANDNINLIFLGEGEERTDLELYSDKTLSDRVRFTGRVDNPYSYIQRADIFVSCSESEGFPNVHIEALACGTPVISTDCLSGPREILAPGTDVTFQLKDAVELAEYGTLVPVGRPDKICEAISRLLQDRVLYQHYCEVGKKRANDFDVKAITEQYKYILGIMSE